MANITAYSSPNPEYRQFKEKFTQLVRYEVAEKNLKTFVTEQTTQNLKAFVDEHKEQYKAVLQEEFKQITQREAELAVKKEQIAKKKKTLRSV